MKLILNNKATAIINTVWQRCVYFQFSEVKSLVKVASKTANLVEIAVEKHIFHNFLKKEFSILRKFAPKTMLLPGKSINCQHLPNFLKQNQFPICIMSIWGFLQSCWNILHQCTFPTTHSSENCHSYPDLLSGANVSWKQEGKLWRFYSKALSLSPLFCFVLSPLSFKPHPKIHVTEEHAY